MNRFDYSHTGGMPIDTDHLNKIQMAYLEGFKGLAQLIGNNTIISGVEQNGGFVNQGFVVLNDEILYFKDGPITPEVGIIEEPTALIFENGQSKNVEFKRYATCVPSGQGIVLFVDLVRLEYLKNIWMPGDIKEKIVNEQYISENFDVDGFGINREKGWRILSKAIPETAGRFFVNYDEVDPDYNTVGLMGGAKQVTLTVEQIPPHTHDYIGVDTVNTAAGASSTRRCGDFPKTTQPTGGGQPHENRPPYYVVLKLIRLY
ncbi:MAG: hypothetical protein N2747_00460 [Chitinophagaceae bacterium]|nr:hypothetical protein [Chitinophagaceae bacterium]